VLLGAVWHLWACLSKLGSIREIPLDYTRNPGVYPVTLCRVSVKLLSNRMDKNERRGVLVSGSPR